MSEIKKQWWVRGVMPESFLFGFVLLLMIIRFYGLFQSAELPGWDTPSHFFALNKMATEYLPQGHITGYVHEWMGGMPLFQFYAPFFFILVSGAWLITFKLISLALLFRIFIFLSLFGVVISFYYFLKVFFNRSVARFGIVISSLYIFYPKIYSTLGGIGAGAGIWVGFVSAIVGLSFVLLWLSFLEQIRKSKKPLQYFILSSIVVCLLVLTHTLSAIVGIFAFGIYCIYHIRNKRFLIKAFFSFVLGIGLSAFWLIPFVLNLDLSSAGVRGFGQWPFNLFYLLFPFKIPYFFLSAIFHLFLVLGGIVLLIKAKRFFIPLLFVALSIFIILRSVITWFFPDVTFHYSRFFPILYVMMLVMAAYCLNYIWQRWGRKNIRRKIYISTIVLILVLHSFLSFDMGTRIKDEGLSYIPYGWRWEDYTYSQEVQELLDKIKQVSDSNRIFVQMSADKGLVLTGSMNYFTAQIPLKNNQRVITGGYPESSLLTPFILPTLDAFTKGGVLIWGDVRLRQVLPFYNQDMAVHIKRLQKFGVNYIAAHSPAFISTLESLKDIAFVNSTEHFKIFKLNGDFPFVYSSFIQPGLYINADDKISFKDMALALFSGENTFDIPIVKGTFNIDELNQDMLDKFSALIISGSELKRSDIERLWALDHPLILIGRDKDDKAVFERSDVQVIEQFEVIPKARRQVYSQWPLGWEELQDAVHLAFNPVRSKKPLVSAALNKERTSNGVNNFYYKAKSVVKAEKITSEYIEISGSGPIIINAGYSPYWQYQNCKTCEVFQVTPANMMIFSTDNAILKYSYDNTKVVGIVISLISLLIVILILFFKRKICILTPLEN